MWKMLTLTTLSIFCASPALISQQSPPAYEVHGHCEDGLPHFQSWFNSTGLPSGQPYVAKSDRKERVLDNYSKLKLEMTMSQVEQLLGKPDFSAPRASGHLSNDVRPAPAVCSDQIAYMLMKTSDNMADTSDEAIYLLFSPDGKLSWAAPQNLPRLQQLGGPQQ
jgi:hypothetical protein